MLLWSAFIMGLVGNFHCLGMCGPIALAIPVKRKSRYTRFWSVILYNTGRIFTYALFGLMFGLFGKGLQLSGIQQYLSIALGIMILAFVLFPYLFPKAAWINKPLFSWTSRLKQAFRKQFAQKNYPSLFVLGLLNGLLPCGLVYMALAGALASGTWQQGTMFMVLFGTGTLPVMFALPYFGQFITQRITWFKRIIPIVAFMFGALLILRGANLGIPYISPQVEQGKSCCKMKCH